MEKILRFIFLLGCCQSVTAIRNYYMDTNCGQVVSFDDNGLSEIKLYLTKRSTYLPNMQCTLTLTTRNSSRFMLYFKDMNVESSTTCNRDWLDVRDGMDSNAPYISGLNRLCGSMHDHYVYQTSRNGLFLKFTSDNSVQYSGFQMIITSYHYGICDSDEYDCNNGRCVSDHLTCNGENPCGDHSDCPLAAAAIAGIVVGSLIFVLIVAVVLIVLRRRRRRYRRRYVADSVVTTQTYGTSGYNQPVPQQYPGYPTGPQYPPQQYPQS